MMTYRSFRSFFWIAVSLCSAIATNHVPAVVAQQAIAAESTIDFARQVQPILAKHCYACHGPDEAAGGLQFTSKEAIFSELDSGLHAIVAHKPGESEVFKRLTAEDEDERMPAEADPLPPEEIEIIRKWIEQGAQWSEHWGFSRPQLADVPKVDNAEWNQHPIDQFIYKQLEDSGLKPNRKADRRTLIRRATYDLTGLPPTFQEVESFLNDHSEDAFEKLTGRFSHRSYLKRQGWLPHGPNTPMIQRELITLPEMLQSNGYRTAAIGKYHVGMAFDDGYGQPADEFDYQDVDFTKPLLDGPTHHGFDEFFGVPGNMEDPLDTEPRVFIRNDRWIFELDKKSLTPPEARLRLL